MKFLLLLVVLGVAALMLTTRSRGPSEPPAGRRGRRMAPPGEAMVACAHCGLHLPQSEAVVDAGGRPYCSEAHRLAGPRGPA